MLLMLFLFILKDTQNFYIQNNKVTLNHQLMDTLYGFLVGNTDLLLVDQMVVGQELYLQKLYFQIFFVRLIFLISLIIS